MAQLLVDKGLSNVQVILGGWAAWQSFGLPIEPSWTRLDNYDPFAIETPAPVY